MAIENPYGKSFLFGVKFFALILLLVVPPIVGGIIGYQVNALLKVIPLTAVKGIEIQSVKSSDEKLESSELVPHKENSMMEVPLIDTATKKQTYFYVTLNRPVLEKNEQKETFDEAVKLIVKYGADIGEAASYEKSVSYDHLTVLGAIIQTVVVVGLIIGGLAAYFPIFLLFRNLFKKPKS